MRPPSFVVVLNVPADLVVDARVRLIKHNNEQGCERMPDSDGKRHHALE